MKQEQKRVVVYIPPEDYKNLRVKLILLGMTVSEWFRKQIKAFLNQSSE